MKIGLAAALALSLTTLPLLAAGPFSTSGDGGEHGSGHILATVTGQVTDQDTGRPLGGVQVWLEQHDEATLTDPSGRYTLSLRGNEWTGRTVRIRAATLGYTPESAPVTLEAGTVELNFQLSATTELNPPVDERDNPVRPTPTLESEVLQESVRRAPARTRLGVAYDMAAPAMPASMSGMRMDPDFNTESYAYISENGFRTVADHPLSTFSIDVDRASYSNLRRFLTQGQRPPVDAIRVEEMINYFAYDYPDATGEHPFSVTTDVMPAPWNQDHRLVRIGVQGRRIDMSEAPASNLVFLLDVSGSMASPDKLPLLKQAFRMLVAELRPQDRVAIVVYAGAAGLVLPSTAGNDKETILDALSELEAGGSTAGGAGIRLAYDIAQQNFIDGGNNRIVLATDGDFNIGASSDSEMVRLIERKRESGTFLTVLGFGTGNLKDSKMEQIADHGNGNYAYIDSALEAKKVLVTEMGGTLLTIAKDVKIQAEFNPQHVAEYRLVGYENRLLANEDFNNDAKDAGELGAGHSVTVLYEVVPVGVSSGEGAVDPLRYGQPAAQTSEDASEFSDEMMFVKLRYKAPDGDRSTLLTHSVAATDRAESMRSRDLGFVAAVAGFGMLLRESPHAGNLSLDDVLELARAGVGQDAEGYRSEFVRLVERAQTLELVDSDR